MRIHQSKAETAIIVVESHRKKLETLRKAYPDALILDVTSHATGAMKKLSPFYPHMGIPVPFSSGVTAASVEGIWQGLKTFEHASRISSQETHIYAYICYIGKELQKQKFCNYFCIRVTFAS